MMGCPHLSFIFHFTLYRRAPCWLIYFVTCTIDYLSMLWTVTHRLMPQVIKTQRRFPWIPCTTRHPLVLFLLLCSNFVLQPYRNIKAYGNKQVPHQMSPPNTSTGVSVDWGKYFDVVLLLHFQHFATYGIFDAYFFFGHINSMAISGTWIGGTYHV